MTNTPISSTWEKLANGLAVTLAHLLLGNMAVTTPGARQRKRSLILGKLISIVMEVKRLATISAAISLALIMTLLM